MNKSLSLFLIILFFISLILYIRPQEQDGVISMADIGGFISLTIFCILLVLDMEFLQKSTEFISQNKIAFIAVLLATLYLIAKINLVF